MELQRSAITPSLSPLTVTARPAAVTPTAPAPAQTALGDHISGINFQVAPEETKAQAPAVTIEKPAAPVVAPQAPPAPLSLTTSMGTKVQANATGALMEFAPVHNDNPHNLQDLKSPADIIPIAGKAMQGRAVRLMISGYSKAPSDDYEPHSTKLVDGLVKKLGADNTALVTSPTADKGSVDGVGTAVAQKNGIPAFYVTAKDYVPYINPDNFPSSIDKSIYEQQPKYVAADSAQYSDASAKASSALLLTGGRDQAVLDFVNNVKDNNGVVVWNDTSLPPQGFDTKKNRPNDAAGYVTAQLNAFNAGQPLPYPDVKGFNLDFLQKNKDLINSNVSILNVNASNDADLSAGIDKAADKLTQKFAGNNAETIIAKYKGLIPDSGADQVREHSF
jgi:hypothetical protein